MSLLLDSETIQKEIANVIKNKHDNISPNCIFLFRLHAYSLIPSSKLFRVGSIGWSGEVGQVGERHGGREGKGAERQCHRHHRHLICTLFFYPYCRQIESI